jgi:hypothetical protein
VCIIFSDADLAKADGHQPCALPFLLTCGMHLMGPSLKRGPGHYPALQTQMHNKTDHSTILFNIRHRPCARLPHWRWHLSSQLMLPLCCMQSVWSSMRAGSDVGRLAWYDPQQARSAAAALGMVAQEVSPSCWVWMHDGCLLGMHDGCGCRMRVLTSTRLSIIITTIHHHQNMVQHVAHSRA